jgi:anaerobic magnesium-protoporphyrin IX monomethyl ester cyclase
MKVLFIHCNINTGNNPHFVPGVGSISSILKEAGHSTALIFIQEEVDRDFLLKRIEEEDPGLIAFSTLTNQMGYIRHYSRWIKERFSLPIIYGGVHATVVSDEILAGDEASIVCIGEGEFPMLELVERLEKGRSYEDIPNLWVKASDGSITKNPPRPLIQDLDSLPFPDRELFSYRQLLLDNPMAATLLMAGRGCPFACKYCVNNTLHRLYRGLGKYVRMRSPERVLEELRFLVTTYGLDRLFIYDDTFTYDHLWLEHFCDLYRTEFRLPFSINLRVDTVNERVLRMLREAGCEMIVAGVESGSERIRREIMGRKMSNEQILHVFRIADELGMKTWTNNMIGMPTETPEDVEETIRLTRLIRPNNIQITVFYPFPGTELYDLCKKEGYFSDRQKTTIFEEESILDLPTLSNEEIRRSVKEIKRIGRQIQFEKEQKGSFDFLLKFPEATVTTPVADYVQIVPLVIKGDERATIFAHPESRITYTLEFPEQARLCFGMGLSSQVWSADKGSGVDFEVILTDNGSERVLFSRYIDPKNNSLDQKWHDVDLELFDLPPGPKQLHFVTTTKERNNEYCWAHWSHPFLYSGERQTKNEKVGKGGVARDELVENWPGKDRRIPERYEPAYLTLKKIADFLQAAAATIPLTPQARILDVGCGDKPYFPFFAPKTMNYYGVDIQSGSQTDVIFDGKVLPFGDEVFDLILNNQVLEHTEEPQVLMDEMYRVLRGGADSRDSSFCLGNP